MGIWRSKFSTDSGSDGRGTTAVQSRRPSSEANLRGEPICFNCSEGLPDFQKKSFLGIAAGIVQKHDSAPEPTEEKEDEDVHSDGCEPFLDEANSRSAVCEDHERQSAESPKKVAKTRLAKTQVVTASTITTGNNNALSTSSVTNSEAEHDAQQGLKKGATLGSALARDCVKSLASSATSSDKGERQQACRVDLGTGEDMVGMRIKRQRTGCIVQRGRIADYNSGLKLYKVTFDDGKEEVLEWLDLEPALLHDEHESDIVLAERVGMVQIPRRYPRWRSINELLAADEENHPPRERSLAEVISASKRKRLNQTSESKSKKRKQVRRS